MQNGLTSNFTFLQNDFPQIFAYAYEAEKRYIYRFYDDCVTNLGVFAEALVSYIADNLELDIDTESQFDKINILYDMRVKKALELQEKGVPIKIVKEADISL